MLVARGLSVGYGRNKVLSHINISISEEEFHVLLGANGSGKSTLLQTLGGFHPALDGEILLDQIPISNFSTLEIARKIAINFTSSEYSPFLTVKELYYIRQYVVPYEQRISPLSIASETGTQAWLQRKLCHLSDGERQKVWLASAIAQNTPLLFLDEPTAFMDISQKLFVFKFLKQLSIQKKKGILLITHDIEFAFSYATHVWIIDREKKLRVYSQPFSISADWLLANIF